MVDENVSDVCVGVPVDLVGCGDNCFTLVAMCLSWDEMVYCVVSSMIELLYWYVVGILAGKDGYKFVSEFEMLMVWKYRHAYMK